MHRLGFVPCSLEVSTERQDIDCRPVRSAFKLAQDYQSCRHLLGGCDTASSRQKSTYQRKYPALGI